MKKKFFSQKLVLNKETISDLDMDNVKGGYIKNTEYGRYTAETCNTCGTPPPNECETTLFECD